MRLRLRRVIALVVTCGAACGALELTSGQQKIITLSNGNPNYGNVQVNTSKSATFTFTPQMQGVDDDTVTMIAKTIGDCAPYTPMVPTLPVRVYYGSGTTICVNSPNFTGFTQAPFGSGSGSDLGSVCSLIFSVLFRPMIVGEAQCDVEITYHQTSMPQIVSTYVLHLDGSGVQEAGLLLTPPSIAFGNVRVNSTSTVPLNVKNVGTMGISVTGANSDSLHTFFNTNPVFPGQPFGLAPGVGSDVDVSCTPQTATTSNATISFHGITASSQGSDVAAPVSCTGIVTNLDITPIPINFPTTVVGRPAQTKSVTITNVGTLAGALSVTLDSTAMGNGVTITADPSTASLAPNTPVMATVAWMPPGEHVGSLGNLVVHISTDGASNFNVAMNGEADLASLGTLPGALDFGPVCSGTMTTANITAYAVDAGDFKVNGETVTPAPLFSVVSSSATLKGHHMNDLSTMVTVQPTMEGDFNGTLVFSTDIPGMPDYPVKMKGTTVAAGITATPDLTHFGGVMPGLISSEQKVTVTNCSTQDLLVSKTEFSGATPDEFTVVSPPTFPLIIPMARSTSFNVAMTPKTVGPKNAMLTVTADSGLTTALFDGTGVGSDVVGDKDRETYYACSVGDGAAAWPIGLAGFALRRRRKRH